ncbi:predicted protein [Scheffersomyces stipitis CBS 6054]|uniref:Uncharacterized protein n=1 Tax=Scheffersomyces stipitis (strain ATCC 58785 / CBS 6054 / NBRC 10063 / NRRL Y-11545) TaxID=322104 RepID=A3LS10_PICST|nr:predicted protein [Scheffersomyces stipitis CBS 6054]ABN65825.1 predicted protein [Scheffersomyces stipitis CBS 6054]KAG2733967.1 hypothetical protein G9P44_003492 [Scheffersomyces stipitis]
MSSDAPKLFHSKLAAHISSYTPVAQILSYLATISIVSYAYKAYVVPAIDVVNTKVLSQAPVSPYLSAVDAKADSLLSTYFDGYIIGLPLKTVSYVDSTYVKPTNDYLIAAHNKYFPETAYSAKASSGSVETFAAVINSIFTSLKTKVSSKSSEISTSLISTYNAELSTTKEGSLIAKNLEASYNTATKTIKTLNDDYIQPLKIQTQGYVAEVTSSTRSKADSLISEAKSTINPALQTISEKTTLLNGSAPVVSASA